MQRPVLFKRCSTFWLAGAAGLFACLLTFALAVHGGGQVFDGFFVLLSAVIWILLPGYCFMQLLPLAPPAKQLGLPVIFLLGSVFWRLATSAWARTGSRWCFLPVAVFAAIGFWLFVRRKKSRQNITCPLRLLAVLCSNRRFAVRFGVVHRLCAPCSCRGKPA